MLLTAVPAEVDGAKANEAIAGSDLFTNDPVIRIHLELRQEALESLRDKPRKYVRATIREGDKAYPETGIQLKGSLGSFRSVDDKPCFTLDFGKFGSGRKFHGLRKVHLNNSVEDPSYVNEKIGSELFDAAGVPAARAGHALVVLNGRRLGLYVLKEGFTEDFLGLHFKRADGNLYEPDRGQDVEAHMRRVSGREPQDDQSSLKALADAVGEPDADRRWLRLEEALEIEPFVTFMAMEVMIGHRDGYSLVRNNFRVYCNPETTKPVFLPHGMDHLFGKADLTWKPRMGGGVARMVMDTPEGRQRYEARFRELFANLFAADKLTNRVNQILDHLRPCIGRTEFEEIEREASAVRDRIVRRERELTKQLSQPELRLLEFKDGIARPAGWARTDEPMGGKMEEIAGPEGRPLLHIVAGPRTSASWRTTARLRRGRYRFTCVARIAGVKPLPFGRNQGAGLRVAGEDQPPETFTGDSSWKELGTEFQVSSPQQDVELICELRAGAGEAWFDKASFRLIDIQ